MDTFFLAFLIQPCRLPLLLINLVFHVFDWDLCVPNGASSNNWLSKRSCALLLGEPIHAIKLAIRLCRDVPVMQFISPCDMALLSLLLLECTSTWRYCCGVRIKQTYQKKSGSLVFAEVVLFSWQIYFSTANLNWIQWIVFHPDPIVSFVNAHLIHKTFASSPPLRNDFKEM